LACCCCGGLGDLLLGRVVLAGRGERLRGRARAGDAGTEAACRVTSEALPWLEVLERRVLGGDVVTLRKTIRGWILKFVFTSICK
jgi:hypothetical protein